jgi:serine/threonine-protein kinase
VVDEVFQAALDIEPEGRADFVEARTSDEAVRLRVFQLLSLADASDGFLEAPTGGIQERVLAALDEAESVANPKETDRAGEVLGSYRLIRPIGRGGMASVWLAERADGAWSGQVAVKLIRKGLDTDDVLRRFRAERQILSALAHPGICRLLDGGETDSAQPYLVMEFVDGRRITDHCDAEQLGITERLGLFLEVARAVSFAHRAMVVHRDLKPSNILVDAHGQAKLLDFGIAKLLDPDVWPDNPDITRRESRLLTPEYASPEQLRGDPVTAASDTFQLGVLLYQLLTLESPFPEIRSEGSSLQSRLARHGGPVEKPSALVARTSSDDADRFREAMGLVPARAAGALEGDLDLVLLKALDEDAEGRYRSVAALADDLEAYLAGRPVSAQAPRVRYRLGKFLKRNRWVAPTAALFALLLGGYGASLVRSSAAIERQRDLAQLEAETAGQVTDFLVGLFGQASPYAGGSVDIPARELLDQGAERLLSEPVDDPVVQARLVEAVADAYSAFDLSREAAELLDRAFPDEAAWSGLSDDLRLSLLARHGHALVRSDRYEDARTKLSEALRGYRARGEDGSSATIAILADLSEIEFMEGNAEQAIALSEEWVPQARALAGVDNDLLIRALDRQFHLSSATVQERSREAMVHERLAFARELYGEATPPVQHALDDLVAILTGRGAYRAAEPAARDAVAAATAMFGEDNLTTLIAVEKLGEIEGALGRSEDALARQRRVLAGRLAAQGPENILIPITRMRLAKHLRGTGRLAEAEVEIEQAIPPTRAMFGDESSFTALMLEELGQLRFAQGRLDEARTILEDAGAAYEARYEPTHIRRVEWAVTWTALEIAQGNAAEAEPRLLELTEQLERADVDLSELRERVIMALIEVYEQTGRASDAEGWERRLEAGG